MAHITSIPVDKMISVTEARRTLGELLDRLPKEGEFYLLRGGKIAARLSLLEPVNLNKRREGLWKAVGSWVRAEVPDDVWKRILRRRRSRAKTFHL